MLPLHAEATYSHLVLMTGTVLIGLEDIAASETVPDEAADIRGEATEHRRQWESVLS